MFVPSPKIYVVVPEMSFLKLQETQQLEGWIM